MDAPPPHPCYLPSCDYVTIPGLSAESQLRDLDMHMQFAHANSRNKLDTRDTRQRPNNSLRGKEEQKRRKKRAVEDAGCCDQIDICQDIVLGSIARAFRLHGRLVAEFPSRAIFLSTLFGLLCSGGILLGWKEETDMLTLWQPQVTPSSLHP